MEIPRENRKLAKSYSPQVVKQRVEQAGSYFKQMQSPLEGTSLEKNFAFKTDHSRELWEFSGQSLEG